ncbi:MAG: hypothetical protein KJ064_16810 [Anaerolineae bacterium]|nr:hypothetical protein [Anaerolineae bacterium]
MTRAGGYDISDFSWSPDGQHLAVGLYSGTGGLADSFVFIWNVETDVIEQRLVLGAADLDWHPTAPLIAQTPSPFSYETRNSIIDAETGTIEPIFSGTLTASAIDWSPDGTKLALVYDNPVDNLPSNTHLAIWDLESRSIISDYEFEDEGIAYFIRTIQWGPDNRHILVVDGMDMYVWDSVENHVATDFGVPALQADWLYDGSIIAYFTENERSTVQYIETPQYAVHAPTCTSNPTTASDLISDITTANGTSEADTICLTESATYTFTTAHIPLNALPVITSEITIIGNGATLTRQVGSALFGFFEVSAGGNLTLDNLTLNGGDVGNDTGGALVNEGGTVTLNNVTFSNNHANTGGAIDNESGSLTITDSTFENNQADYGGAIDNDTGSTLSISGSTFTSNTADLDGGAIHNDGGTLTVTDSTFTSNTASRYGGALDNTGSATISGSTFAGNSASWSGGAIHNTNTLTIIDSVFSNNTATSSYGSLYLTSSSTTTAHSCGGSIAPHQRRNKRVFCPTLAGGLL